MQVHRIRFKEGSVEGEAVTEGWTVAVRMESVATADANDVAIADVGSNSSLCAFALAPAAAPPQTVSIPCVIASDRNQRSAAFGAPPMSPAGRAAATMPTVSARSPDASAEACCSEV